MMHTMGVKFRPPLTVQQQKEHQAGSLRAAAALLIHQQPHKGGDNYAEENFTIERSVYHDTIS